MGRCIYSSYIITTANINDGNIKRVDRTIGAATTGNSFDSLKFKLRRVENCREWWREVRSHNEWQPRRQPSTEVYFVTIFFIDAANPLPHPLILHAHVVEIRISFFLQKDPLIIPFSFKFLKSEIIFCIC